MTDIVINIEHVSKEYQLGVIGYGTLMHDLQSMWARWRGKDDPNQRLDANNSPYSRQFLALNNVSFQVRAGETLGIIGANGAGKSTLLKILSRITTPGSGRIVFSGRIASLLEVGTGFHSELTGRENIFMNGAILGMSRREILRKFDRIVEFSGVERFLDTPVKRYSSGMYVRLAFAVAAHLDAEILLVDEVLAVGDTEFQRKCLGRMRDATQNEGRTVLFVSHNMEAVHRLCNRIVLLEHGRVQLDTGNVSEAINCYNGTVLRSGEPYQWTDTDGNYHDPLFIPIRVCLTDSQHNVLTGTIHPHDDVYVVIEGTIEKPDTNLGVGYVLFTESGAALFTTLQHDTVIEKGWNPAAGSVTFTSKLPTQWLHTGTYTLALYVHQYRVRNLIDPNEQTIRIVFRVEGVPGNSPYWEQPRPGYFAPVIPWTTTSAPFRTSQ
ncbi:MAG: ATP-binding cassette domain-containing protein [Planctomycetaceae bacterium]|jgi:lipopolysaccharide transport system ATP-binding protein|nr:ATP-binding cassette domain-containing protein [Planctomycetaceae bacterium]